MTPIWTVEEQFPKLTLRIAFTNLLDITSPPNQSLLMYLSSQASAEKDRAQLIKLAKVCIQIKQLKAYFFKYFISFQTLKSG